MGLSSKKTTTENKPIYSKEIKGAADAVTSTYNSNIGNVQGAADAVGGLIPSLVDKYQKGDAGVNAARDYNVDVLGGKYLDEGNPYLEGILKNSNDAVRNQSQVALGSRGLAGTSDYQGIIADRVSENDQNLRYQDYGQERQRMATAAGQSPSLAAADYASISPLLGAAQSTTLPMQAASGYGSTIGGLLGQYQKQTQSSSGGFLPGLIGAGLSGWASGGFG